MKCSSSTATDFNNSYDQMLIYPQARGVRQEETVEVAIINDDINELNEEFLLFFNVVNDNIPVIIITDPFLNPTRCRIMNDDRKCVNCAIPCHPFINDVFINICFF